DLTHPRHLRRRVLATPLRLADRLRGAVLEGLELLALFDETTAGGVEVEHALHQLRTAPVGEPARDRLGILADQPEVQHGRLLRFDRRGAFGFDAGHGADVVVRVELDDADAPGVTALGGDISGVEADDLALGRHDEDVVAIAHLEHGDDVAVATAGAGVRDRLEHGLLGIDVHGREEDVAAGPEVAYGDARGDRLALAEREEVHHRLALRLASAVRDLVDLETVELAEGGEEEEIGVGRGDKEVLDDVLLLGLHARHALAAAPLAPVRLDVRPLDVARARDRDDHLLIGQEVLDRQLGRLGEDLGAPDVAV